MSGLKGEGVGGGGGGCTVVRGSTGGERKEQQREVGKDRQVEERVREAEREMEKLAFQKAIDRLPLKISYWISLTETAF